MARLFILAFLIFLATLGANGAWFKSNNQQLACFFLFWILALLLFSLAEKRPDRTPWNFYSGSFIGWTAFFTWGALGFYFSVRPELSFEFTAKYLGAILLLFTLRLYLRDLDRARHLLRTLAVIAAGHGILCWTLQSLYPEVPIVGQSLFLNSNFYGDYLLFPLAGAAFLFLDGQSRKARWTAWGLLAFLFANVLFTGSRGALLASIGLLACLAAFLVRRGEKQEAKSLTAAIGMGTLFFIAAREAWAYFQGSTPSTSILRGGMGDTMFFRQVFWENAWQIFREFPLTGSGPWTFKMLAPLHQLGFHSQPGVLSTPVLPHHAHNWFLHTASDMGLVGLGLACVGLGFFFKEALWAWADADKSGRLLALCLGSGMVGYLLHNLLEYCWPTPAFIYTFTLWVGLVDFLNRRNPGAQKWRIPHPAAGFLLGVFGLWGCGALIATFGYAHYMEKVHSVRLLLEERLESASQARTFCPSCDAPHLHRAFLFARQFEVHRELIFLEKAKSELGQALRRARVNPDALMIAGILEELQGNYQGALRHYTQVFYRSRNKEEARRAIDRIAQRKWGKKKGKGR